MTEGERDMSNIVAQWYEDKKNVDEMQSWNSALKEWERFVVQYLPSGAKILDIGCGLGREAFALADLGYDVVGIDISKEVISQVKQLSADKGYKIPFYEYDGAHLDFPSDYFDVVLILHKPLACCMETSSRKDICRNVKEFSRKVDYAVFQHMTTVS